MMGQAMWYDPFSVPHVAVVFVNLVYHPLGFFSIVSFGVLSSRGSALALL
jgi:hypothetical protein